MRAGHGQVICASLASLRDSQKRPVASPKAQRERLLPPPLRAEQRCAVILVPMCSRAVLVVYRRKSSSLSVSRWAETEEVFSKCLELQFLGFADHKSLIYCHIAVDLVGRCDANDVRTQE